MLINDLKFIYYSMVLRAPSIIRQGLEWEAGGGRREEAVSDENKHFQGL